MRVQLLQESNMKGTLKILKCDLKSLKYLDGISNEIYPLAAGLTRFLCRQEGVTQAATFHLPLVSTANRYQQISKHFFVVGFATTLITYCRIALVSFNCK